MNKDCKVYRELVVLNRGHVSSLNFIKELKTSVCPVCKTGKEQNNLMTFRNCGFVNCEWVMRGSLKKNPDSKIYADGRTYDNKLYTFKEIDYRETWNDLDIYVKKLAKTA